MGRYRNVNTGAVVETEHNLDSEWEAVSDGSSSADTGYGSRKVEELQAEVDKRGLQVEGSGKDGNVLKSDLVAALEADDSK